MKKRKLTEQQLFIRNLNRLTIEYADLIRLTKDILIAALPIMHESMKRFETTKPKP